MSDLKNKNVFPEGDYSGMNMLQYYSGLALQGILANNWCQNNFDSKLYAIPFDKAAEEAVQYAYALIAELEKQPTP